MKSEGPKIQCERPEGPLTDLERSEFYLQEGERLAHMGSWSLRADGRFDYWSGGRHEMLHELNRRDVIVADCSASSTIFPPFPAADISAPG